MNKQYFLSLVAFTCLSATYSYSQDQQDSTTSKREMRNYREHPAWIDMMNEPNVNYFEACKAFDLFWENKEIPSESEGEAAMLYGDEKESEKGIKFKNKETYQYIYDYKKFINWRRVMENKVNSQTGRLLTQEQQLQIWKQQTEGINTSIE
jgi:hypothetical protein